ncbi:MAG: SCO family protein [Chloroflexota bacterium]
MSNQPTGRWWTPVFFLLFLLALLTACGGQTHEFAGAVLEEPKPVPDFTLTAAGDTPVSLSDFRGEYVYLYFGYTFCPDACPITLSKLSTLHKDLGDDADEMQVIMVTVDPERDTPDVLADYVTRFDPSFIGLAGSKAEIDAAGQPFGIYYQRSETETAGGYLIDHSTRTYLIDPAGNARVAYSHDTPAEDMLTDLQWLIANES